MRKPFFLLLPSSLFQKGIPAVEANVHKMYLDYMDVTKRGKGWGREGKGRAGKVREKNLPNKFCFAMSPNS